MPSGKRGNRIPIADVEEVRAALAKAGAPFEIRTYPGAGHGFFSEDRAAYHAEAAAKAWAESLRFLAEG